MLSGGTATEKHSKRGSSFSLEENIEAKLGFFVSKCCQSEREMSAKLSVTVHKVEENNVPSVTSIPF